MPGARLKGKEPPCAKCPYTLEQIRTPANPCLMCRLNGYKTYEKLLEMARDIPAPDKKKIY